MLAYITKSLKLLGEMLHDNNKSINPGFFFLISTVFPLCRRATKRMMKRMRRRKRMMRMTTEIGVENSKYDV